MVHNHNDRSEPSRLRAQTHQSRHDTRGIALQTVIIMVVMLAIAGAVAAVLLSRGSETTGQLESQAISSIVAKDIKAKSLCENAAGVVWATTKCKYATADACRNAGGFPAATAGSTTEAATGKFCTKRGGGQLGEIV